VGGLLHRGDSEYLYRLSVTRPEPTVKDTVSVTAGKTNELKLSVTRKHGHGALLKAAIKGLPPGVTAVVPDIRVPPEYREASDFENGRQNRGANAEDQLNTL